MAQTKDLVVIYNYVSEKGVEQNKCLLSEIPEEHKATVTDIRILNTKGIRKNNVGSYITGSIHDFPELVKLYFPEEYSVYISNTSFKNCPNLKTFFTIGNGTSHVSGTNSMGVSHIQANDENLGIYRADAALLGIDKSAVSYVILRESVATEKAEVDNTYLSNATEYVKKLYEKIEEINSLIHEDEHKIKLDEDTIAQVFTLVEENGMKTVVFEEEFNKLYDEVSRVNLNVDQKTIDGTVQTIVGDGLINILLRDFENVAKKVYEQRFKDYKEGKTKYNRAFVDCVYDLTKAYVKIEQEKKNSEYFDIIKENVLDMVDSFAISNEAKTFVKNAFEQDKESEIYTICIQSIDQAVEDVTISSDIREVVKEALQSSNITEQRTQTLAKEITDRILTVVSIKGLSKKDYTIIKDFVSNVVRGQDLTKSKQKILDSVATEVAVVPMTRFIAETIKENMPEINDGQVKKLISDIVPLVSSESLTKDKVEEIVERYSEKIKNGIETTIKKENEERKEFERKVSEKLEEFDAFAKGVEENNPKDLYKGILSHLTGVVEENNKVVMATNQHLVDIAKFAIETLAGRQNQSNDQNNVASNSSGNINTGNVSISIGGAAAGTNSGQVSGENPASVSGDRAGSDSSQGQNTGNGSPTGTNSDQVSGGDTSGQGQATGDNGTGAEIPGSGANQGIVQKIENPNKVETPDPNPKSGAGLDPNPGKKKEPKKIKVVRQRTIKEIVKEEARERLNMLKERKPSIWKKMGQWITRHPFATALIGVGVGALAAVGVGSIMLGGISHVFHLAKWFSGYVQLGAAIGLGAGVTTGALGTIISKVSRKGKIERAFHRVLKSRKKHYKAKNKVADYSIKINALTEQNKELRKQKGVLKALKVTKLAAKFNNFKKKIYRKRIKANKKKVRKNLDKAMSYKSRLNELEDRNKSGKDRALDSYMNKRRKAEAKLKSGQYDKDDFADKMEELEDSFSERPSIDGEAQSGLQEVSKKYRTFDTEILEMIEGTPEEDRKDRDIDTYAKILGRNSKSKQVEKEKPMIETYLSEEYDLADMDPAKIDELKKDPETYKQYLEEKEKQQAAKDAYERIKKLQPEIAKALEEGKTIKTPIPEPVKDDSTAEK